jgi:flagellar biosynthesis/type III secretory pathway chaperone
LTERFLEGIASSEQRLLAELARHTRAIQESMSTQISVVDEKYNDLPARVSQLEATVFPPEQR